LIHFYKRLKFYLFYTILFYLFYKMEELFSNITRGSIACDALTDDSYKQLCLQTTQCLQYINKELNWKVFHEVCSALQDTINAQDTVEMHTNKPSSAEVWGYGILCVSLISLTSVVGVAILPLMTKAFYSRLLSSLIGLAVGSLSGSAVFHLIPSAFRLSEYSLYPHHSYLNISLTVLLGMYLFFLIERFLKIFMDSKARRQGTLDFGHTHSHQQQTEQEDQVKLSLIQVRVEGDFEKTIGSNGAKSNKDFEAVECEENQEIYNQSRQAIRASFGHVDKPHPNSRPTVEGVKSLGGPGTGQGNRIATVAWMIIFGDGIHNFIDGLSIGAAFSESVLTGISVSVAVLCEEFPHELGDFAVLLNSGMSVREALLYNFLSACTCYLGLVLGIMLGELDANCYIFGLAGGMFLYISLVDMVPEMNESVETASKKSVGAALAVFTLQNIGILIGIISLYILARFQDDIIITF